MNVKIISKIFVPFLCLLFFASVIAAQTKVSEYTEKPVNPDALAEMAGSFAEQLAAEPSTTRGFINVYSNTEEAEKIKSVLSKKPELKKRVEFFQPGVRYRDEYPNDKSPNIEFWIVPKGTDAPFVPNCVLCNCPEISVGGVDWADNKKSLLTFTSNVSGGSGEAITYKWKISAGKIIEGQDTPVIKVDAQGAKEIIATVEIDGVCEECIKEASFTTKIKDN